MKKSFVPLLGLFAIAFVFVAQYATGSNAIIDYLGTAFGFLRSRYLDLKTTTEEALNTVTGGSTGESDPMDLALPIIADFEGFVGHAYQDVAGVWTIGYGHAIVGGDGFQKNTSQTISQGDAWDLLRADAGAALNCVQNEVGGTNLSAKQIAALTSFCYNVGCGAFTASTMVADINAGNLDAAVGEFSRWKFAGGKVVADLQARRTQEAALFSADLGNDTSIDDFTGDSSGETGEL